jgi:chromosome segregation ATPase
MTTKIRPIIKRLEHVAENTGFDCAIGDAIEALEAQAKEITKLRSDLRLHAGDCASLSNELDLMREQRNIADVENAKLHARIAELEWTVEELRRQARSMS